MTNRSSRLKASHLLQRFNFKKKERTHMIKKKSLLLKFHFERKRGLTYCPNILTTKNLTDHGRVLPEI